MLKTTMKVGLTVPMIAGMLGLHLVGTVFEGIGLTILLPVFQLIQSGQDAATLAVESRWWGYLVAFYEFFGLEVSVLALLVTSFVAILLRQVIIYFRLIYTAHVKFIVIRSLRDRAFNGFLHAKLGYGEQDGLGRIVNDVTTEAQVSVEGAMARVQIVGMLILAFVYLGVLLVLSVEMTAAAIAVLLVATAPLVHFIKQGRRVGALLVEANSSLLNFLSERFRSARLVRLSGMEQAEFENMRNHTAEQYRRVMEGNVLRARTTVVIEPFAAAAGFLLLYFGATEFGLSLDLIGLFLVIVIRLVPVIKELANVRFSIANSQASINRILGRLASLEDAREVEGGRRESVELDREVRFKNVHFTYDSASESALNGVNLSIPARKMTAIVGPSGSGKSTLIDMLPRLRVPQEGEVYFDGVPAGGFRLSALREAISYAPQSPQLFNVTIREHIHYGQPDASHQEIERAARLAGAHDFIVKLADSYDTVVSESGSRLSGGQRQRIDLARAILKPAKILILDEPTSQLDAESERKFTEALRRVRDETELTIVMVGHRFSTLLMADRIAVLENGRVLETGNHGSLIARNGWYSKAYRRQNETGLVDELLA